MEEYESESQQIEQIKAWFSENGTSLVAGVALVLLAYAGYFQWGRWQDSKSLHAADRYNQVLETLAHNDRAGAIKLADSLRADAGASPYADQADLAVARASVEASDFSAAESRLTGVVDHTRDEALRVLARYRLARVQRAEGHPDAALKTLDAAPALGFAAAFAEVRGDIALDRGDRAEALKQYLAAAAVVGDGLVNHDVLDLKITSLGGSSPKADAAAPDTAPVTGDKP